MFIDSKNSIFAENTPFMLNQVHVITSVASSLMFV